MADCACQRRQRGIKQPSLTRMPDPPAPRQLVSAPSATLSPLCPCLPPVPAYLLPLPDNLVQLHSRAYCLCFLLGLLFRTHPQHIARSASDRRVLLKVAVGEASAAVSGIYCFLLLPTRIGHFGRLTLLSKE